MYKKYYLQFRPFIAFGLIIVMAIIGVFVISSLFIAAAVVGAILYGVTWLRRRFFRDDNPDHKPTIYEHGEY